MSQPRSDSRKFHCTHQFPGRCGRSVANHLYACGRCWRKLAGPAAAGDPHHRGTAGAQPGTHPRVHCGCGVLHIVAGRRLAKVMIDVGAEMEHLPANDPRPGRRRQRFLWPGDRRLVVTTRVDLDDLGREYLEASLQADRSRRRRAKMGIVVVAVLGVIVGAAVAALMIFFVGN